MATSLTTTSATRGVRAGTFSFISSSLLLSYLRFKFVHFMPNVQAFSCRIIAAVCSALTEASWAESQDDSLAHWFCLVSSSSLCITSSSSVVFMSTVLVIDGLVYSIGVSRGTSGSKPELAGCTRTQRLVPSSKRAPPLVPIAMIGQGVIP